MRTFLDDSRTVNGHKETIMGLAWQIILALSSIIINQCEAYYPPPFGAQPSASYSHKQQSLNDYYLQSTGLSLPPQSNINNAQHSPDRQGMSMDESTKYQLTPDQLTTNSGGEPTHLGQLDQIDLQKLAAYLARLQDNNDINENTIAIGDLNSHLSPTDPDEMNTISGPVNDPADFEAVLSQLTNTINHELPNSSNRSATLDNLLSVYLGTIMQQLKQQQQGQQSDDNDADSSIIILEDGVVDSGGSSLATTEAELNLRGSSAAPPVSRYGGGEYIDHPLALIGHQYVQGGAGEGRQLLGPDGAFENVQVVKSDHAVPSYCDPPNPCPIGFTAEDGCLEKFVNSASFSREYQVKQQCSCDNEHSLFNCASPTFKGQDVYSSSPASTNSGSDGLQQQAGGGDGETGSYLTGTEEAKQQQQQHSADNLLETLARTIQNRFGSLASIKNLIGNHEKVMIDQATNDQPQYSTIVKKGFQIDNYPVYDYNTA